MYNGQGVSEFLAGNAAKLRGVFNDLVPEGRYKGSRVPQKTVASSRSLSGRPWPANIYYHIPSLLDYNSIHISP
jgi:hypothetical protein